MPVINYATGEVEIKIVYYGAAFSGKTTNLKAILSALLPEASGLTSLQTGPDRTLFFELTPPMPVMVEGFTSRVRIWTVPGESLLNGPRQLVLRDVDGVVFVVDPQWSRVHENVATLVNLEENLRRHRIDPADLPLVFQYNKTDLPNPARRDYLEYLLNRRFASPRPSFDARSLEGENVIPCLERILELVVEKFWRNRAKESLA